MDKLQVIDKYLARLVMVSFFLPLALQATVLFTACGLMVIRAFVAGYRISLRSFKWALLLGGGYFLYLLSLPLTPPVFQDRLLYVIGNKVAFLLVPLLFSAMIPLYGTLMRRQLIWFVYGCLASCLYANAAVLYYFAQARQQLHALTHVHYRIGFERYSGIHPTYMGMYLCFSVCILLSCDGFTSRLARAAKYGMLYLLLIFALALLAKSPLIALLIIFIYYAVTHRSALYRYRMLAAGVLLVVAAAWLFIPFVSQRINEAVQMAGNKSAAVADNSISARKLIWNTDIALLKKYWLTGIGPGRVYHTFQQRYLFYSLMNGPVDAIHDPHNEYIYEWLSFGLIGLVTFGGIFFAYLFSAIRAKDYLYLCLLIILYVTFFTETVLATQRGLFFYSVFTALFFFSGLRIRNDSGTVLNAA